MDNLPQSIRDIVDVVGLPAAIGLVNEYGGLPDLKVPLKQEGRTWSRLVAAMGVDAAARFVERYAGERLPVPMCKEALRHERNRAVNADYDEMVKAGNVDMAVLVRRYNLTTRQLRNIFNTVPGETPQGLGQRCVDDRQMDLF